MKKKILALSFGFFFVACKFNNASTDSAATKNVAGTGDAISPTGLTGIWAKDGDDNPAFEINRDSIFYADHATSYPYEFSADTLMIHYKGFIDTFKSKMQGNDTLILSSKADGLRVYHRYKN